MHLLLSQFHQKTTKWVLYINIYIYIYNTKLLNNISFFTSLNYLFISKNLKFWRTKILRFEVLEKNQVFEIL